MDTNPYSAPQSDVSTKETSAGTLGSIRRIPTFLVIVLYIVTGGIYNIYWMINRSMAVNRLGTPKKVSMLVLTLMFISMIAFMGIYFQTIVGAIASGVTSEAQLNAMIMAQAPLLGGLFVVMFVTSMVWLYSFRKVLHQAGGIEKGSPLWLGGIITFFFQIYYLNYKINQISES